MKGSRGVGGEAPISLEETFPSLLPTSEEWILLKFLGIKKREIHQQAFVPRKKEAVSWD